MLSLCLMISWASWMSAGTAEASPPDQALQAVRVDHDLLPETGYLGSRVRYRFKLFDDAYDVNGTPPLPCFVA